jgi:GT2 family glycosyltransferase
MDLSIIIVNWNTSDLTLQCLESIYADNLILEFEIIVVDNGSTDESVSEISRKFPDVHIISNDRNLGFACANNQGLAVGRGRYYLLLNSDTLVLPETLNIMIRVAEDHPEVGMIGPKLLNMDGSLQKSWASFPSFLSELLGKNFRFRHGVAGARFIYEVDWIMGACMLVRSDTVTDVGLMDENYFKYSEETDWCFRIKSKGWKIWYLSNFPIYHLGGGSANRSSLTQLALLYYSKILFFQKHYGNNQATFLRYGLALANSIGVIRRTIFQIGMERSVVRQRLVAQSQLILCLLKNQYPDVISKRTTNSHPQKK